MALPTWCGPSYQPGDGAKASPLLHRGSMSTMGVALHPRPAGLARCPPPIGEGMVLIARPTQPPQPGACRPMPLLLPHSPQQLPLGPSHRVASTLSRIDIAPTAVGLSPLPDLAAPPTEIVAKSSMPSWGTPPLPPPPIAAPPPFSSGDVAPPRTVLPLHPCCTMRPLNGEFGWAVWQQGRPRSEHPPAAPRAVG
jgi:hypothetical protein